MIDCKEEEREKREKRDQKNDEIQWSSKHFIQNLVFFLKTPAIIAIISFIIQKGGEKECHQNLLHKFPRRCQDHNTREGLSADQSFILLLLDLIQNWDCVSQSLATSSFCSNQTIVSLHHLRDCKLL